MKLIKNLLDKIKYGLQRTQKLFLGPLHKLLGLNSLDEAQLEELEGLLLQVDMGVCVVNRLINKLKLELKTSSEIKPKEIIKTELLKIVKQVPISSFSINETQVLLVVGVNGVGKTTTIAKLANYFKNLDEEVLLVAGDTFRAAAIDQLVKWGERLGVRVIHSQMGSDPAAVAYDSAISAMSKNIPWVIIDTAGRLHNKDHLMRELGKIKRSLQKVIHNAPHRVVMILDATTGQNGLVQAKAFQQTIGVTDLIVTKLDGTAKGGVIISILEQLKLPIAFIGVGESLDDLVPFNAEVFISELLDG